MPEPAERQHLNFWMDLAGRIGAPIFAVTLVGCLMSQRLEVVHGVLLAAGVGLIFLNHRYLYHR